MCNFTSFYDGVSSQEMLKLFHSISLLHLFARFVFKMLKTCKKYTVSVAPGVFFFV